MLQCLPFSSTEYCTAWTDKHCFLLFELIKIGPLETFDCIERVQIDGKWELMIVNWTSCGVLGFFFGGALFSFSLHKALRRLIMLQRSFIIITNLLFSDFCGIIVTNYQ